MERMTCLVSARPEADRAKWLESRKSGIGGSDIGTIYEQAEGIDGYGCVRHLLMRKIFDYPEEYSPHIERGKFLEEPVARLYADRTGRVVNVIGTARIKEMPWIMANADRLESKDGARSVVEIKCPSRHVYKKYQKEGIPPSYIAQIQWQMLCYGTTNGTFVVYCAETHEIDYFDIKRDNKLIDKLISVARSVFVELENIQTLGLEKESAAEQLRSLCRNPESCEKCASIGLIENVVKTGDVQIDASLDSVIDNYNDTKSKIKDLEALEASLKADIEMHIGPHARGFTPRYKITNTSQSRESANVKDIRSLLDKETADKIIRTTIFNVMRITEVKK